MLPFQRSDAMLWQAETGFAFHTANGYVLTGAPAGVPEPELIRRLEGRTIPTDPQPLLAWARRQGVTTIVAAGPEGRAWVRLLSPAVRAQRIGGVYLLRLRPVGRSECKAPSA
jgi:hypothetical protein